MSTLHAQLAAHYAQIKDKQMRELFAQDAGRAERFSLKVGELLLDYSKNRITSEALNLLLQLAEQAHVATWRERMFNGDKINNTEHRAVLHTALRNQSQRAVRVDGENVMPAIHAVLDKMAAFTETVRAGTWLGYTGKPITDIVNIGIGGSDLGPQMVCQALKPYGHTRLKMHFMSNIDGAHVLEILEGLDPATTLFIIASKTFTTQETMTNAQYVRKWF